MPADTDLAVAGEGTREDVGAAAAQIRADHCERADVLRGVVRDLGAFLRSL